MDLLIDGCPLQTPARDRGIGRYTTGLLSGLKAVRPQWTMTVIEHGRLPAIPPDRLAGVPSVRFDAPLPYDLATPQNYPVNDRYFADWLLARHSDHVLFASVFEKLGVVPHFTDRRPPTSAVMYDLIPVLFPEQYNSLRSGEAWYAQRFRDVCRLDRLFAISAAATADARRLLGPDGPPVSNIRGAVNRSFVPFPPDKLPLAAAKVRAKYGVREPFLLYVGGEDYRKNLTGALAGFGALPPAVRDKHQLVIACGLPDHIRAEVQRAADKLGVSDRVVVTGFVSDDELILLYQTCRVFFFPSLYEGLGLPVIEALTCGAPVACSNLSSLPEFAGDVSWQFDPHSPRAMADALAGCLAEPREQRRAERERFAGTFTWEKTAEAVATGIEAGRRPAVPRRPRLAWLTSTAPDDRPQRLDSFAVLGRLAQGWDVEVAVPTAARTDALAARHLLLSPDELNARADADPFDLCVTVIGDADPDPGVLAAAVRRGGLVVLNHPHPSAYRVAEIRRVLARAAAVVVSSADVRTWVRNATNAPVVLTPAFADPTGVAAADWLGAVARDAVGRTGPDRRWLDGVANALADLTEPPAAEWFDRWAKLRLDAAAVA